MADIENYGMVSDIATLPIINRKINVPRGIQWAVSTDSRSRIITFSLPRYQDGIDMSEKSGGIKYINATGVIGKSIAVPVDVTDDEVLFGWIIDHIAAANEGQLQFSAEFIGVHTDGTLYRWNTTISSIPILPSIEYDGADIEDLFPSLLDDLQWRLFILEKLIGDGGDVDLSFILDEIQRVEDSLKDDVGELDDRVTSLEQDIDDIKNKPEYTFIQFQTKTEFPEVGNGITLYLVMGEEDRGIYSWDTEELDYVFLSGGDSNNMIWGSF